MALSGTIERQFHGGSGGGYFIGLDWRVNSQSVGSNSSNVTATVYIRTTGNGYSISSSASKTVSVTINGTKYLSNCTVGIGTYSKKNLFSKTVDVPHNSDGNKVCDFACALDINVTLGGTWYGKISHSGQGTFDRINLNTAPWWTSDDTHIVAWGNELKADTIIPENTNDVIVWSSTAWDNEQGGNLHFDIHRYVNGSHSAQIKWGGANRDVTDYLANWGAGTVFKYEAKVHDGQGLWASGSRWSWVYTKNRFSPATVGNVQTIGPNQNTLSFTAYSARNQGGLCNNNYGYRITSLTPGVNIYGNREVGMDSITDVHFTLGIKNNGGEVPINPHWLDANEIKAYLANSGYNGNIRLRIESWNSYGSSGNADFNVWVDLRKNIPYTNITYNSGWITHKGSNYYIPGHLPIDISWNPVTDPMGGAITYEVLYQIGDGAWTFLADVGTATKYKASLISAIGNNNVSNFRFIIKAKTSYGKISESGSARITLHSYSPPTVRINEIVRNKTNAIIKGSIQINTSLTGGTPTSAVYSLNSGNSISFLDVINQGGGNPFAYTVTTGTLESAKSYSLSMIAGDSIGDALRAKGVSIGNGSAMSTISVFIPVFSLRKSGVGVNAVPDGSAALIVNGGLKVDGTLIKGGDFITKGEIAVSGSSPYGKIPKIGNDGVMEIGRYIDFHLPGSTADYDGRLTLGDDKSLTYDRWLKAPSMTAGNMKLEGNDLCINSKRALVGWASINDPLILNFSRDFHGGIQAQSEFHVIYNMNYDSTKSPNNTSQIAITSGNNGLGIGLSSDFNSRNAWIQVGHNDSAYSNVFGSLRLNPKGGTVWIHNDLAMSARTNGEYYGLCIDNDDGTWIRTPREGLIPYSPGIASNIGTGSWCFNQGNFRYVCSPNGQNIDIEGRAGLIYFNVNSESGCGMQIDRSWGGTAGSEACLRNNKGDGWGFLGNTGNKFFRIYSSGGSVGSYKPNKYDISKYDTESLYNYVKDMGIYLYRTRSRLTQTAEEYAESLIKTDAFYDGEDKLKTNSFGVDDMKFKKLDSSLSQEDILNIRLEEIKSQFDLVNKDVKRGDLMLGTMIHELPTEVVDYDTEGNNGKTVELYSYATMAIGAIKHLQGIVDNLNNRITELEGKTNGVSN